MTADATKTCRFCGEQVLAVAIKCKHCHSALINLAGVAAPSPSMRERVVSEVGKVRRKGPLVVGLSASLVVAISVFIFAKANAEPVYGNLKLGDSRSQAEAQLGQVSWRHFSYSDGADQGWSATWQSRAEGERSIYAEVQESTGLQKLTIQYESDRVLCPDLTNEISSRFGRAPASKNDGVSEFYTWNTGSIERGLLCMKGFALQSEIERKRR